MPAITELMLKYKSYNTFFLGIPELINPNQHPLGRERFVPSVVNGNAWVSRGCQVPNETPVATSTFASVWWIMSHSQLETNRKINCVSEWGWKWDGLATTEHALIRGPQVWHFLVLSHLRHKSISIYNFQLAVVCDFYFSKDTILASGLSLAITFGQDKVIMNIWTCIKRTTCHSVLVTNVTVGAESVV